MFAIPASAGIPPKGGTTNESLGVLFSTLDFIGMVTQQSLDFCIQFWVSWVSPFLPFLHWVSPFRSFHLFALDFAFNFGSPFAASYRLPRRGRMLVENPITKHPFTSTRQIGGLWLGQPIPFYFAFNFGCPLFPFSAPAIHWVSPIARGADACEFGEDQNLKRGSNRIAA